MPTQGGMAMGIEPHALPVWVMPVRGFANCVMAGFGPATHELRGVLNEKSWMVGPSPAMTRGEESHP
jgi:hypothetical protein